MTRLAALALAASLLAAPAAADEIWVSNEKDDTISVIDVETLEVVRTIPVGERPRDPVGAALGDIVRVTPLQRKGLLVR